MIYIITSLSLTFLFIFLRFMLTISYKKKNTSLFNSISNKKFKDLMYLDLFINNDYHLTELERIKEFEKDAYTKEFLNLIGLSWIPVIQIFMLSFLLGLICRLLFTGKNLSELYPYLNKNTDTTEAMIDSLVQFNLLKKYLNPKRYNDKIIKNVISTVYNTSHPYKQLIKDNFDKLLDLVTKKESKLDSTISECKKIIIKTDIESIMIKFIDLINNINENLIEKEINELSNMYSELISMSKLLKEENLNIYDILSKYEKEEIPINELKELIEILSGYIYDINSKIILKKIFSNTETIYYNFMVNLLSSISTCVFNLELKKQYIPFDEKEKINRKIEYTILEYISIITTIDELSVLPIDNDVVAYNNLIAEVINDVKSKKGIFL